MSLKILIPIFFVLNVMISGVKNPTHKDINCVQIVTGEIRDHYTKELLAGVEIMLIDDSNNVLKSFKVKKDANFSFEVKCNSNYKIKAKKQGYNLQEKEFKTTKKKGEIMKLMILLGINKE